MNHNFTFGARKSSVHIETDVPDLGRILRDMRAERAVLVCDANTAQFAEGISGGNAALCVLPDGEEAKSWLSVETIIRVAGGAGLGRDGLFIAAGGGVVSDLCAFAASIYKRGAALAIVSTTLLGMADAALGGKTGFDMFGIKNFAGTFYPARHIYMPLSSLRTLPPREWRSGLAEIIKTSVIDDSIYKPETRERFLALRPALQPELGGGVIPGAVIDGAAALVSRAVMVKGRIVEKDPEERGGKRALLNLGHTFAHALESAAGLGQLSHGEAVAWGILRACELGVEMRVTPPSRARIIGALLAELGYETRVPHPAMAGQREAFSLALAGDKKKTAGGLRFAVPASRGVRLVTAGPEGLRLAEKNAGLT
jgi:3-dehydroquinate synthase